MIITETYTPCQSGPVPDEKKRRNLCFGDSLTWGSDPAGGPRLPGRWASSIVRYFLKEKSRKPLLLRGFRDFRDHSHSMVATGFGERS